MSGRERPILFDAPMVRAILDGRKTQTRRAVKPQPVESFSEHITGRRTSYGWSWWPAPDSHSIPVGHADMLTLCPYGQPGDRLWVRETCRAHELTDEEARSDKYGVIQRLELESVPYGLDGVLYEADNTFREIENTIEAAERWGQLSIYGGRKCAKVPAMHMPRWASRITLKITGVRVERLQEISASDALAEGVTHSTLNDPRVEYRWLWESIYGTGSWDANPWVWVIGFELLRNVR